MLRGVIATFLALIATVSVVKAQQSNLVTNGNLEVSSLQDPSKPEGWERGYLWGDLSATYSYLDTGYASNRSVKATISRYVSGDAKWYFNPVDVAPNKEYLYSNYYQSNVYTEIVLQIITLSGETKYKWIETVDPSTSWQNYSVAFTSPSDAAKISVLHLISTVGYLTIDSVSLNPRVNTGIVPNASVEEAASATKPIDWYSNSWGSNTPEFKYLSTGYNSNRSIQVNVKNYLSGDAKWYFKPQQLSSNTEYAFSNFYKSSTNSRVVVWVTLNDGTNRYLELRSAPSSSAWVKYYDTFVTPPNTQSVSVFHLLSSNGTLTTDNYSILPVQSVGFNRGIVSLTFDDGWEVNHLTALPLMNKFGVKSTQFYATQFIDPTDLEHLSRIKQFIDSGHEIGSHSVTHPDLTRLSRTKLNNELSASKAFLEKYLNLPINNFASPYGAYNQTVIDAIKKYYKSHRTVDSGYNTKSNFDPYRLKVQNILNTTTASEVSQWTSLAMQQRYWLILVYHRIDTVDVGPYDTTPTLLESHLQAIKNSNISVQTFNSALSEVQSQL